MPVSTTTTTTATLNGVESTDVGESLDRLADGAYFREVNLALEQEIFGIPAQQASAMELLNEPVSLETATGAVNGQVFTFDVHGLKAVNYRDPVINPHADQYAFLDSVNAKIWVAHGIIHGTLDSRVATCFVFSLLAPNGMRRTAMFAFGTSKVENAELVVKTPQEKTVIDNKLTVQAVELAVSDGQAAGDNALLQAGNVASALSDAEAGCKDDLLSNTDMVIAAFILCAGAIIGCAVLTIAAFYLCITTGVGCLGLGFIEWICGLKVVTILTACLAAAAAGMALALTAYAVCLERVRTTIANGGGGIIVSD